MPAQPHAQPPTDDQEPPPDELAEQLVPIAAELVGCVHDYGPDTIHQVLNQIPPHRHGALAVVLAAMVDPDRTADELLAWLEDPVPSREFTPPAFQMRAVRDSAPSLTSTRRTQVARLSNLGLTVHQIAERLDLHPRTVVRHRTALRHGTVVA